MIEGIPEGWELVRIGPVRRGEHRLLLDKSVEPWDISDISIGWAVVLRKIEKSKQFRPFESAEEFRAHRDRWWRYKKEPSSMFRPPCDFGDDYYNCGSWDWCFENCVFDDGSPFGVEVVE